MLLSTWVTENFETYEEERSSFKACCPAHDDTNPSLVISVASGPKLLMNCRAGCSNRDVLSAIGYGSFREVHEEITEYDLPEIAERAPVAAEARQDLAVQLTLQAGALAKRVGEGDERVTALLDAWGAPVDAAADVYEAFGLGYGVHDERVWVYARTADGTIAFAQGRSLDPDDELRWKGLSNVDGASWDVVGSVGRTTGDRPVIITEGMSDAVVVAALDAYDVYAVRGAANAAKAAEAISQIAGDRPVYVAGDGDEAGKAFAASLATSLAETNRVYTLALPEGKDIKDARTDDPENFPQTLSDLLNTANITGPYTGPVCSFADIPLAEFVAERFLRGKVAAWGKSGWAMWTGKRWEIVPVDRVNGELHATMKWLRTEERRRAEVAYDHQVAVLRDREKAAERLPEKECAEAQKQIESARTAASKERESRKNAANKFMYNDRVGNVRQAMRPALWVDFAAFDADPNLLNVNNGVVDLTTGELMDHNPAFMCTKIANANYDPDATHPDWDKALTALPEDVREWMRARFGQAITGYPADDDIVPFLKGGGANGKSSILDGITGALGGEQEHSYATQVPEKVLLGDTGGHTTEFMTLKGARFAYVEELPEADFLNAQRLKRIAGTNSITARYVHQDNVTFTASHSLFVTTNYDVNVAAVDHGSWRRLALVKFPYKFEGAAKDGGLRSRLRKGRGGRHEAVLAWLVSAAVEWFKNGEELPAMPETVAEDTRKWRASANTAVRFFNDMLVVDPNSAIVASDVYAAFKEWVIAKGQRRLSDQTFWERMATHDAMLDGTVVKTTQAVRTGNWDVWKWEPGFQGETGTGGQVDPASRPNRARLLTGVRFAEPQ